MVACGDSGSSGSSPDTQDPIGDSDAAAGDALEVTGTGPSEDGTADGDTAAEVVDPADLWPELPADVPADVPETDVTTPPVCGSAKGVPPEGLLELKHDDGGASTSFNEQWAGVALIAGQDVTQVPVNQATRFDLEHPVKIHAIKVRYQSVPEDKSQPIGITLRPDFGHNGFDFWPHDVHWEGNLCGEDVEAGKWVTFVFETPVVIDKPQPIYIAHQRQDGLEMPDWAFDLSVPTGCTNPEPMMCCSKYTDCHSTFNLPDLTYFEDGGAAYYFWNGLSLSFPYDFMVRLLVEETDDVTPEEKIFQAVPALSVGSKFSWGDFDGDGWDDLLVDGRRLLRNEAGVLVDAGEEAGINPDAGTGGVWGDYDNDGCLDLFTFIEDPSTPDILYHSNCDGTFTDATDASGIVDLQTFNPCPTNGEDQPGSPTAAATWVDMDGDGFLDLYMGNEICWFGTGGYFVDTVWHNEGDGTFTEWTGSHGFKGYLDQNNAWGTRGTSALDFDRDGDQDIFANNYHLNPNLFYRNEGGGQFAEVAAEIGVEGVVEPGFAGTFGHSVGAAWGDIDSDGDFDLIVASLAHPRFFDFSDKTQVFVQNDDGTFTDTQGDWSYPWGDSGVRYSEGHFSPSLADFDQNGTLDLVISSAYQGRTTDFYWGQGDGTFVLDSYHAGIKTEYGLGLASADMDHDGDLDLASATTVWTNTIAAEASGHWLQIRPVGNVSSNRSAIGATLEITAGDTTWLRHVTGGNGHGCQDSQTVHVGLGEADTIDTIVIHFPGGQSMSYPGPHDADQRLWLYEDGTLAAGWTPSAD
jgi:hypothetical protein